MRPKFEVTLIGVEIIPFDVDKLWKLRAIKAGVLMVCFWK